MDKGDKMKKYMAVITRLTIMALVFAGAGFYFGVELQPEPEAIVRYETVYTPEVVRTIYRPYFEIYPPDSYTVSLSLEMTIEASYEGAGIHDTYIKDNVDLAHHTFWRNVHLSSAKWLEELSQ